MSLLQKMTLERLTDNKLTIILDIDLINFNILFSFSDSNA